MTNEQRFRTADERVRAFVSYCKNKKECDHDSVRRDCPKMKCMMEWLALESDEKRSDEIRRLADLRKRVLPEHWQAVVLWPEHWERVRDALLAYAAMVERYEEVRTKLELNRKDYANRGVHDSLVETNNDEIAMIDYIEKGKAK